MPTVHVYPPLASDVVAAVDVPARIPRVEGTRESNGKRSPNSLSRSPAAGSQKGIVHAPESWRCAGGCERRPFRAGEPDHRFAPGRGIIGINGSPAQIILDHLDTSANSLARDCIAHGHESIHAEVFNETHHRYSRARLPNDHGVQLRPSERQRGGHQLQRGVGQLDPTRDSQAPHPVRRRRCTSRGHKRRKEPVRPIL